MKVRALINFNGMTSDKGRFPDDDRQIKSGEIYDVTAIYDAYVMVHSGHLGSAYCGDAMLENDEYEIVSITNRETLKKKPFKENPIQHFEPKDYIRRTLQKRFS